MLDWAEILRQQMRANSHRVHRNTCRFAQDRRLCRHSDFAELSISGSIAVAECIQDEQTDVTRRKLRHRTRPTGRAGHVAVVSF